MKGYAGVVSTLRKIDLIAISSITIGELLSGFKGASRDEKNRDELNTFLDSPRVVIHPIDEETAEFYASILTNLKSAGTPIPTNNIWIASVAFKNGYKLFSNDSHFRFIPGIVRLIG